MNPEMSAMVCIKVNEPKTFEDLNENSEDRF